MSPALRFCLLIPFATILPAAAQSTFQFRQPAANLSVVSAPAEAGTPAAPQPPVIVPTLAEGGWVSIHGDYTVHRFTSSGTFTIHQISPQSTLKVGGRHCGPLCDAGAVRFDACRFRPTCIP